jgi:hypothetical protein
VASQSLRAQQQLKSAVPGAVDADFRNNVVYDWGRAAAYGEFGRLNYVGNYLKPGPSTKQRAKLTSGTSLKLSGCGYVCMYGPPLRRKRKMKMSK